MRLYGEKKTLKKHLMKKCKYDGIMNVIPKPLGM